MKLYDDRLIVITGGAGFIGSNVISYLNSRGLQNIVIVDELGKTEKWKNLLGKKVVDVISKDECFSWLEDRESEIEAFVHLGACSDTTEIDASYLLENNYRFSVRLAQYALEHQHRFIYASSAATYGDGSSGFKDDEKKLDQLRPLNMYGMSKHLFDLWLKNQGVLDQVTGLKFFNVFGPNELHKGRMASVIAHMVPIAQKEGVVRLFKSSEPDRYPDGDQCRDFIYVKDVAKIVSRFLENDVMGIFNIGTGQPSTWNQVAHAIFDALDKKERIDYVDMPTDLIGKYQNYTCADMQKTKKVFEDELSFTPLDMAIKDYVQNYLLPGKIA
ncbi:MAG: ADP-glyceromanno-heptose 6-epimerase [Parachlamydiaceae bacterium]